MFCVEVVLPDASSSGDVSYAREANDDSEVEYVSCALSMRIKVANIKNHIRDQGSPAQAYYDGMDDGTQHAVVKEIATYAMTLLKGLKNVKAERDENNLPREDDAPPTLPHELVKIRPAHFIDNV